MAQSTIAPTITIEAAVFFGERPAHLPEYHWHPWINNPETDLESDGFKRLVLHRALRDRGGLGPDETITAHIYTRRPGARVIHWTQFRVTKI